MAKGDVLRALLLGGAAGFINGFFGTGGGIVLLFGAAHDPTRRDEDPRNRFTETLTVTVCLSAVSAAVYATRNDGALGLSLPLYLPAIVGGILGAFCLDRCPAGLLRRLFGGLATLAGGLMLFR